MPYIPRIMGSMKDLFGDTPFEYPKAPGFKERTTSREAASRVTVNAETLRGQALEYLLAVYPVGLTADELAKKFRVSVLSMRPRISELHAEGKVMRTGDRRKNLSGMSANVWRAVRSSSG